jgi:sugar diacid utilization regulator
MLDIHPNTVRYRLGRVEAITGLSLKVFSDLLEIVIAVRLLELGLGTDPAGR